MKRICLFAGYDKQNKIQDYVTYLIKQLSKLSDVYYCGNGTFSPQELEKISPYTKMFYCKKHNLKDFGSWNYLISQLGWEKLTQYDEVILCNDSIYGPLYKLDSIFAQMERKGYDFWSITSDYQYSFHLHRYFSVFNKNVITHQKFRDFWKTIPFYYDVKNCELELTPLLIDSGFICNSYIRNYSRTNILKEPNKMFTNSLIPFVKVKNFLPYSDYTAGSSLSLRYHIRTKTDYDTALINSNIKSNNFPQTLGQRLSILSGL